MLRVVAFSDRQPQHHSMLSTLLLAALVAADRPNVLFIMSDDHTTQAFGCYGSRLAPLDPTPNLDRLAREGRVFDAALAVNSICTPSRACILTGQYPHTNGVTDLSQAIDPPNQTLAIAFGNAGYDTAMIGKWHLKREPAAFDFYSVLRGQGEYFDPLFRTQGEEPWPQNTFTREGHSSDAITDLTLEWLRARAEDPARAEQPFFLMHHYKAPHDYFEYAPRYESYLADATIPEPDSMWNQPDFGSIATHGADGELDGYIGTSVGRRNLRRNYTKFYETNAALDDDAAKADVYQVYLKNYLRCVKGVDDNIGRLLEYLEQTDQLDNTVIVYTGDQGFMLGEHDYIDKRWMYEESMRMPLLVRYPPSVPAGSRSDAIVENVDFGPTMLAFAGVETPASMQGRSFHEIATTGREPDDWKQAGYYRYWMHLAHHDNPACVGIRTKQHSLIYYYACGYEGENQTPPAWELYDLEADPKQVRNIYDDPANAELVAKLKQQLAELRRHVGDDGSHYPATERVIQEFWDYDETDRQRAIEISHQVLEDRQAGINPNGTRDR